jgi:hypothetical protein
MQFLSIFLPIVALAAGIAAYIQYRKNLQQRAPVTVREGASDELHAEGETVYQGLLWLKHKYEEDRERSTAKYMALKEEYERVRERYLKLETGHAYTEELLNERQSTIDRLRDQLHQETLRTTEARDKLESSGHLLLKMHKELDLAFAGDASRVGDAAMPGGQGEAEPRHSAQADDVTPEGDAVAPVDIGEPDSQESLVVAAQ